MPVFSASPAAPTPISTSTPGGTSSGRSSSRSTCPSCCGRSWRKPTWKRELVALGTNTDPYQWVESRYRMMPEILAALEEAETPVSVLTKSPLVMRDVEIFERMARRACRSRSTSRCRPSTRRPGGRPSRTRRAPSARLDAVAELRRRGIESGVLIAPLMPGINDTPEQVQPIVDRAREAGATFLGGVALHLRGEVRDVFFGWLKEKRPDLLPRYEELYYGGRAYMRPDRPQSASPRWSAAGAEAAPRRSSREPRRRSRAGWRAAEPPRAPRRRRACSRDRPPAQEPAPPPPNLRPGR